MTFVSYAQNFEDVMLWRALKNVENGFYIDIGAAWPDEHSVTKAFYQRGWHGINVEPNPEFNAKLCANRPRDINLPIALSDVEGSLIMTFIDATGLSTLDNQIAARHEAAGWSTTRREVNVKRLSAIWSDNVPDRQEVHFLKVDVEGLEEAVLRGNDWSKHRPWIVVVEATLPMSQEESHGGWEPILHAANYQLAYADGLNRFYVAQEHADLLPAFKYPPNVFDSFKLHVQQEAETRSIEADQAAQQAEAKAQQAEAKAQQAEAKAQQAEARAQQAEAKAQQAEARGRDDRARADLVDLELNAILNSKSWRITRPLRWASALMVGFQSDARDDSPLGAFSTRTLRRGIGFLGRHPKLKNIAVSFLKKLPPLERRLRFLSSIHETRIHNQERIDATEKLATSILNEGSILNGQLHFSQKETATIMDLLAQALNESSEAHYLARRKRTG